MRSTHPGGGWYGTTALLTRAGIDVSDIAVGAARVTRRRRRSRYGPRVPQPPVAVDPYDVGMLPTPDGQLLYWETVGHPDGVPALHLHGGPGSGSSAAARTALAAAGCRGVLFDQRGCGRSRPSAADPATSLHLNTTAHQIDDIERLREHLGVERWIVVGGSWGVTLGLAYAQRFPHRVVAMVLAAVTAGRRREIDWITRDMGRVFPREWQRFRDVVPQEERDGDLCAAYARLLASSDPWVRDVAARAWCAWEDTHVSLMPGWQPDERYADREFRFVFARLVTHYWSHSCFLTGGDAILANMDALAQIPAVLIHGRYDVSSPLDTAWQLHQRWATSELVVLGDAGHGGSGFADARAAALRRFSARG